MKQSFPEDIDYAISLDQTLPVTEGMKEIFITLVIALVLVILVVYLFLQDWRSTLIPMLAVPVSLIGTFVFFPVFGFSINTLSLLGMVLAIGLVVDDAIVVVEGVQRHIEEGLAPKKRLKRPWTNSPGRSWALLWSWRRYLCRRPSYRASPEGSISSSHSRSQSR